jgi:hypothetical protein
MKGKKIITIIVTSIAALMVTISGVFKLIRSEQVVTKMTALGVGKYLTMLGIMEITFTAIFLFPKTMKLGFILLTCYFSGAIATDLSHDGSIFSATMPLALVWISAFLRDRSIFLSSDQVATN